MRSMCLAGIALALTGCTTPNADDPRALLGEWALKSVTNSGKDETPPGPKAVHYRFLPDDKWQWIAGIGDVSVSAMRTYRTDSKAVPMALDLTEDFAPVDGSKHTREGIYKIEGNKLTLCLARPKKDRPTKFDVGEDTGWMVYVLERVK